MRKIIPYYIHNYPVVATEYSVISDFIGSYAGGTMTQTGIIEYLSSISTEERDILTKWIARTQSVGGFNFPIWEKVVVVRIAPDDYRQPAYY